MSIRNAIEDAKAKELFDLARHLGEVAQVVRPEGDGYVRLSTGDVAEMLLDWAISQRHVAEGYGTGNDASDLREKAAE